MFGCGWKVKEKVILWHLCLVKFQNLRFEPCYGSAITKKCWFIAGFSVNKWSLCLCVTQDMSVSVTGTVQSTSAVFNYLLSKCGVVYVYFWTNLCCSYFSIFFVTFLSAFALIAVSPRPKKSDIFFWATFFYSVWSKWNWMCSLVL